MNSFLRALIAVVGLVAGLLLFPTAADAVPGPAAATYTYDSPHHALAVAYATTERGPPRAYDPATVYNAVDVSSTGASARSGGATPGMTTTYDTNPALVQVARPTATTRQQAQATEVEFAVLDRAGVATDSGVPLIRAGSQGGSTAGKRFPQSVKDEV